MKQGRQSVTVHRRDPEGGLSPVVCTDAVDLPKIGVTLTFATIYDDMPLG